jgi:hypothetical protein
MKTPTALRFLFGAAALTLFVVAAAQVSGAIFTTTPNGAIVNENVHYAAKEEVFLSGGPGPNAPQGAAGVPPGEYYFQVTDPSGSKLLSTDSARSRCVVVGSGGFITNTPCGAQYGPGTHLLNPKAGSPGEYVVQLIPYNDTPNNGGVYKAWLTPVAKFKGSIDAAPSESCGNGCFHGFMPADSKMDNFKVRDVQTYCITAFKLLEDKKEGTIVGTGWPIVFRNNVYHTNDQGFVEICGLTPGNTYSIAEQIKDGFELVATEINGDSISPPATSVSVTIGKGSPSERNPIVVWTNRNLSEQPCTKDCFYK